MDNIIGLLKSQLTPENLSTLSNQLNIGDQQKTEQATDAIFTTLLGALSKNAQSPQGAQGIFNALKQDHDGSILDDAMGFILGNRQPSNSRMVNGQGIVGHLLGGNIGDIAGMISKATGIDQRTVQQMLPVLAPIVMGAVGKSMRSNVPQNQQSPEAVQNLLTETVKVESKSNPIFDLASKFLDQNNDGNITDDVLGMIGKFMTRK